MAPCRNCVNLTACVDCVEGYYFMEGVLECVERCPYGYYGDVGVGRCVGCVVPCEDCVVIL